MSLPLFPILLHTANSIGWYDAHHFYGETSQAASPFSDGNNYQFLRYQLNLKHPLRYRPCVFRERPGYGTKVAASTSSLDVFGNSFKISYSPHR